MRANASKPLGVWKRPADEDANELLAAFATLKGITDGGNLALKFWNEDYQPVAQSLLPLG